MTPITEPRREFPITSWKALEREGAAPDAVAGVAERERSLGIPAGGLRMLGAVWAASLGALACPMLRSPADPTMPIGVRLRADDGRKWAVTGSHNGLFAARSAKTDSATMPASGSTMPQDGPRASRPLYLPEGLTDTAALLGLGLDAVGRPSCTGGRDLVRAYAGTLARGRPMVVVTDADEPGRRGADLLAAELTRDGHRVRVMPPPPGQKDVRAWVQAAGIGAGAFEYMASQRRLFSLV